MIKWEQAGMSFCLMVVNRQNHITLLENLKIIDKLKIAEVTFPGEFADTLSSGLVWIP